MPKIIVNAFLTLDGVMQAPGGPEEDPEGGFPHGGWQAPYGDEVTGRLIIEGIAEADGFLLGRKTYDIFANYWPKITDPNNLIATALNSRPKYVLSRSLERVTWNNSRLIKGDVLAEIQPGPAYLGECQRAPDAHEERLDRRVPAIHLPAGARLRQAALRQRHGTGGAETGGVGDARQGFDLLPVRAEREAGVRTGRRLVRHRTPMTAQSWAMPDVASA